MFGIHHHISTAEAALVVSSVVGLITGYNVWTGAKQARWQRDRDAERRQTRLAFAWEHSSVPTPTEPRATWLVGGPENLPKEYRLRLVVANRSERSNAWVRRVLIEHAVGDMGMDMGVGQEGPVRLEPAEPLVVDLFPLHWTMKIEHGLVAKVHVAPDDWIASEVEHLLPELCEEVNAHNRRGALDGPPKSG